MTSSSTSPLSEICLIVGPQEGDNELHAPAGVGHQYSSMFFFLRPPLQICILDGNLQGPGLRNTIIPPPAANSGNEEVTT
jgi:hypothetical protein